MVDLFVAPVWLLLNFLTFFTAWKWSHRLFPDDGLGEMICHVLVLFWAGIVAVGTVLGIVGWLSGPAMLVGVTAVSCSALAGLRVIPQTSRCQPILFAGRKAFWLISWGALLGFWLDHVVFDGLLKFPTDWDSLAYHIPLVDHWLQAGSLYVRDAERWYSPGNNELLALWAVGPFSGDFLVSLNNLPAALLLASAALSLGKRLGLSESLANLGALALVSNLVVLYQLVDAENDVAVVGLFLAALLYIFRHLHNGSQPDAFMAATCLGLLAGIKYYATGYAALALGTWLLFTMAQSGWRPAGKVLLVGMVGTLAFGGYWYLRNLLVAGSSLYPRDFFKDPDELTLMYSEIGYTSFFGNGRPELLSLYIKAIWRMAGPCHLAAFLLVPLSLGWLASSTWWKKKGAGTFCRNGPQGAAHKMYLPPFSSPQVRDRLALAMVLAGTGLLLGMTPLAVESEPGTLNQMHWQYSPVRYGLCFLSVATLAALLLVQQFLSRIRPELLARRFSAFFCLAMAATVLFQLHQAHQHFLRWGWLNSLLLAESLALFGLNLYVLGQTWPRLRVALALGLAAVALLAGMWGVHYLVERWHQGFARHYDRFLKTDFFTCLEKKGTHQGKICVLEHRYYPFFGSRRQHRLCQPVRVPSPQWFMNYVQKEKVDLVVAHPGTHGPDWNQFQPFDERPTLFPERFRKLHESGIWQLFQVLPAP